MRKKKFIKITQAELEEIMGDFLKKIEKNCFCGCKENNITTIVKYSAKIDDLNDTLLEGYCVKCGKRVNRYLETGENPELLKKVKKIRKKYEDE